MNELELKELERRYKQAEKNYCASMRGEPVETCPEGKSWEEMVYDIQAKMLREMGKREAVELINKWGKEMGVYAWTEYDMGGKEYVKVRRSLHG